MARATYKRKQLIGCLLTVSEGKSMNNIAGSLAAGSLAAGRQTDLWRSSSELISDPQARGRAS